MTIMATDALLDRLRAIAAERHVSLEIIIREALEEKAASYRRLPRSLGMGNSGHSDISRRIGEERFEPRPWR